MMSQHVQWGCTSADQASAVWNHHQKRHYPSFISPQNKSSAISPKCKISFGFFHGYFMLCTGGAALILCKAVLRQNCRAGHNWIYCVNFSLTTLPYQTWDLVGRRGVRQPQHYWKQGYERARRGMARQKQGYERAWQDFSSWKCLIWYHNKDKW